MQPKQLKTRYSELTDSPDGIFTVEEERSLAEAVARGDAVAREQMILAHRGLAAKIALQWKGRGLDRADLISEAMCGLIRAVDLFDSSRGVRFSTLASFWIKQSVSIAVQNAGNLIVMPSHMSNLIRKWKRAARALTTTMGRVPTPDEIAESLGLSRSQARNVVTAMAVGVKLASTIAGEGSMISPLESCVDEKALCENQQEQEIQEGPDEVAILRRRLKRLDVHERAVLTLRYGLDGRRPRSLERLAACVGISRPLATAIQLRAEEKLRKGSNPRARSKPPTDS